jgi:hypothetical protein
VRAKIDLKELSAEGKRADLDQDSGGVTASVKATTIRIALHLKPREVGRVVGERRKGTDRKVPFRVDELSHIGK